MELKVTNPINPKTQKVMILSFIEKSNTEQVQ